MRPSVLHGLKGDSLQRKCSNAQQAPWRTDNDQACESEDSASGIRQVATCTFLYVTRPHDEFWEI